MTKRRALLLQSAVLAAFGRLAPARAQSAEPATAFVKRFADQMVAVVNGPSALAEQRRALTELIDRSVDVDGIARFCLGRFWNQATPEQQSRYVASFHQVLVLNITAKVGEYKGVTYTLGRGRVQDDQSIVSTVMMRPNNPPTNVDWVVGQAGGGIRIIDVVAEGTSLRLTQRQDYASFMSHNNNSIDALITAMRNQASGGG